MNLNILWSVSNIIRTGSIITNLALSGYLFFLNEFVYDWFFSDTVQELSSGIIHHGETNPLLGVILLLAVAGEFTAFILKARYGEITDNEGSAVFLLWMFHSVVAVIMTIVAMGAFGITFESRNGEGIMAAVLFGTVIKELIILIIIITDGEKRKPSKFKTYLADLMFFVFYSLAYTTVIGNTLRPNDYNNYLLASHYSVPLVVLYTFVTLLLFFMLYLPLRIPYFLYERYESGKDRVLGAISILLVAAAAILPLFEGEVSLERALENPASVKILFLNSTGIDEIPEDVQKLTRLEALNLGFNRLKSIPPWINKLEKLEWIGLGGNSFREFPVELLTNRSIKEIDLHYNRIKKMPEDLSPFRKLKSLNLKSNMLLPAEKNRLRNELGNKSNGISLQL